MVKVKEPAIKEVPTIPSQPDENGFYHCYRCGYKWESRLTGGETPAVCARCKNPRFMVPRNHNYKLAEDNTTLREENALRDYLIFLRGGRPAVVRAIRGIVSDSLLAMGEQPQG